MSFVSLLCVLLCGVVVGLMARLLGPGPEAYVPVAERETES